MRLIKTFVLMPLHGRCSGCRAALHFSLLTVAACLLLAGAVAYAPRCQPGDPGVYVGGMLVGGCPR